MVPTTVERLREGQGVRERLLRGIKMERCYKRADESMDMESGEKKYHALSSQMLHVRVGPIFMVYSE